MPTRTNILIIPHHGEDAEGTLKRFKKVALKVGLFKEIKRRVFYEKPSEEHRRKRAEALKKYRKTHDPSGELKSWVAAQARHYGDA